MALPKGMSPQTDFSAGQLNSDMQGSEEPVTKAGVRRLVNARVRNTKRLQFRPGRRVIYSQDGRVDVYRMNPVNTYHFVFHANGAFSIRFPNGTIVPGASTPAGTFPWNASTVDQIRWTVYQNTIVVCYPGIQPFSATLEGGAWVISLNFAILVTPGDQKRMPFYRIAPRGITLTPSGLTGAISIAFSDNYLVNDPVLGNMVGNRLRYAGRQMTITGIASSILGSATVNEPLLGGQLLSFAVAVNTKFNVGDVLIGATSGAKGQVASFPSAATVNVVQLNENSFQPTYADDGTTVNGEMVSGPTFSAPLTLAPTPLATPPPTTVWDEEVFNAFRGWPQSVSVDQGRLIFCDFPAIPQGIAWSAFGVYNDFYVGAGPTDAMFELIPQKGRVLNVSNISAAAADEIVLADNGVWMIPISSQTGLKPGTVVFQLISPDGSSRLRPAITAEGLIYINAGLNRVIAIFGSGFPTRPYNVVDLTKNSYEILGIPRVMAATTGDGQYPERYIFIQQLDGGMAVGRYDADKGWCGWATWRGREGLTSTQWVSASHDAVIFTTIYATGGLPGATMVESLDDTLYLDSAMLYNAPPVNMVAPSPGLGKVWWQPGGEVSLMDGHKPLGTRSIDPQGNIITIPGDDLSSPTLVVGVPYEMLLEPFVDPPAGQQAKSRPIRRRISMAGVTVERSTGFVFQNLYSGAEGEMLPAPGTVMSARRIPAWFVGDNQGNPPRQRDQTYVFRPRGRSYQPRIAIVKDIPGPMIITEVAWEITV